MNFIQHPSNNFTMKAPKGCEESCSDLPMTVCQIEGLPVLVSFWQPTAEELQALANGGAVMLHVYGQMHPMVYLSVEPLTGVGFEIPK